MAEIILVRHGQANSLATNEADYDRLSDLGWQQSRWLGGHLRDTNVHFDHVVRGDMRRHRETAEGIGLEATEDARWNELSYFGLSAALEAHKGIAHPQTGAGFYAHALTLFDHWIADEIPGAPEPWAAFDARIMAALRAVAEQGGRSLVVTSGGVVGAILRRVLGLETQGHVKLMTQTANTSVHRLEYLHDTFFLAEFNATPHLDSPERVASRTHY
jgi:broad specificity phosphatase PhoE